jgi:hypothetical protein
MNFHLSKEIKLVKNQKLMIEDSAEIIVSTLFDAKYYESIMIIPELAISENDDNCFVESHYSLIEKMNDFVKNSSHLTHFDTKPIYFYEFGTNVKSEKMKFRYIFVFLVQNNENQTDYNIILEKLLKEQKNGKIVVLSIPHELKRFYEDRYDFYHKI